MNVRNLSVGALATVLVAAASVASAHGPQLQIVNDGGKIVTNEVLHGDYTPISSERSALVAPVSLFDDLEFGPAWRMDAGASFGPGLAYGVGATFPTDSTLTLSLLDELQVWDGAAFVSAGATELAALRTSNPNATALSDNAGISGSADPSVEVEIGDSYTANAHASITWVLLGDGADPASAVADGVYVASFEVASSDPSIGVSDPYHLVLNKGPAGELVGAVSSLGLDPSLVQYVGIPEPGAALLAALGGLVAAVARRS